MIEISLLGVANLVNSSLFAANCALIRKILSHFSFAPSYAEVSIYYMYLPPAFFATDPMMIMNRFPIFRHKLILLIPALALLTACQGEPAPQPKLAPGVMVTKVEIQSINDTTEIIARTEAVNDISLRARVQGYLLERRFIEGDDVEAGDVLFVIDPEAYAAEVANVEAKVEKARSELLRASSDLEKYEKLFKTKTISEQDILKYRSEKAEADAELASIQAQLRKAESDLAYTTIKAPISGRIGRSLVSEGNLIDPNSGTLARLVELDPIYVNFAISERDLISIKELILKENLSGAELPEIVVTLRLPNDELYAQKGKLNFLDNVVDSKTGTVGVRAVFSNPDRLLVPGMFVHALIGRNRATDTLVIPEQAKQQDQAGSFVMVVDADNKVDIRRIKTRRSVNGWLPVEDGLQDGEWVVVEGIQKVRPGMTVTTKVAPLAIKQEG